MEPRFAEGLTFDDVLLVPQASGIEPREAILETSVARGTLSRLNGKAQLELILTLPFLSAAMDRVTESKMVIALGKAGGLGVLHRNCTIAQQVQMVREAKAAKVLVAAACGPFDSARATALDKAGADAVVIDCAHGHNLNVIDSAKKIKKKLRRAKLIFGNIATAEAARAACTFADAVKVGVGPGSICTTRLVSGVGVPQLSAIMDVARIAAKKNIPVIADGGIKNSGDIAKALAAGASAVMLGNLFAGCQEAPGKIVIRQGKKYKEYRGMGSRAVIESVSAEGRYLTKGRAPVPEGVTALIAYKGSVASIIAELASGVQVAFGYIGARNILAFQRKAKFIRITPASVAESGPHTLSAIVG